MLSYQTLRSRIKSGDLLAWSHRSGWFSSWYDFKVNVVRAVQMSEYSHVGVAFVAHGRVWVIESVTPVVRMVPLSNLLPCYVVSVKDGWNDLAERYALGMIGKGEYSQIEAMKAFFRMNHKEDDHLECAEFVQQVYRRAGWELTRRAVPSDTVLEAQMRGGKMLYLEA